jgi:hypothetical protein
MKRTIIARFEIEDNDVIEQKLFDGLQCEALKDFTKIPDTSRLYDNDENFRKICKAVKVAKKAQLDYIHKYNKK